MSKDRTFSTKGAKALVLCAWVTMVVTSCTSAQLSHRRGLFDQLENAPPTWRRSSAEISSREIASVREHVKRWRWPLDEVVVTSPFGERDGRVHEGIDLKAGVGTAIKAADDGTVIYANSRIGGYGRMIVLKHDDNVYSVYAHLSKRFVANGQKVRKGERIALSGATGKVTGPHLHFEVRKGVHPVDPERVMSQRGASLAMGN